MALAARSRVLAPAPASRFPDEAVTKDWRVRLAEARAQKNLVVKDIQEAYFFTRPRLSRQVTSTSVPRAQTNDDAAELATGIGGEVSEDFATEVIAAFFPQNTQWAETGKQAAILAGLEDEELDDFEEEVRDRDEKIFASIKSSNFDAELATALDPDASIGTVAFWIDAPGAGRNYRVDHVPARELEFLLDPNGDPGDRFRVRWVKAGKLRAVVGELPLPEKIEKKIKDQPGSTIEVVWCFGRDWSKPHADEYDHVLMVDGTAVHTARLSGEGCLPLLIARFSPDKLHAWGNGPAIKSLQEFRVLDVITAATQDRVDQAISPPIGFPDDGVIDFEGGIEAGKAYPMRPGSGRDIAKLYFEGDPDLGFFTATDLEKKIRRKFFADYPEQKGDTPPTATQWVDEMVRAQRRIGTPGLKFWREGPYQVFRRFEYLLEKDGKIADVKIKGQSVALSPNNPATQAQDNQKLQVASQLLSMCLSFFPETSKATIDERATIENLQKLVKDEVVKLRAPAEVKQMLDTIMSAAGGMAGAAPEA